MGSLLSVKESVQCLGAPEVSVKSLTVRKAGGNMLKLISDFL